jgi:hypothetical protein
MLNAAIDRVEDVYDESVHNLDAFTHEFHAMLGDHSAVRLVTNAVDSFVVHYVLNMFNGVKESYETAIKPFAASLAENVSAHLTILNLGWVVAHEDIHRANIRRAPALLPRVPHAAAAPAAHVKDPLSSELARLASQYLGDRPVLRSPAPAPKRPVPGPSSGTRYLDVQLDTLRRMSEDLKGASYRENFKYIVYRSLHVMKSRSAWDFGDTRIFKEAEIPALLQQRGR